MASGQLAQPQPPQPSPNDTRPPASDGPEEPTSSGAASGADGAAGAASPQAAQMVSEPMLRTLRAQAEAIWPQEAPLFGRYDVPTSAAIADVGCGTGEITARLAERYSSASIAALDIEPANVARAAERCAAFGSRVRTVVCDVHDLAGEAAYDLTVCRHMLQAVPRVEAAFDTLVRVTKPGGWLHLIAEDYTLIHFHPTRLDADAFWRRGPIAYGAAGGTDLCIGRRAPALLAERGVTALRVDYVIVDTVRVARELFAAIWEAWRDGFTDAIAANTELSVSEVRDHFVDMLSCIRSEHGYGVWLVPVISGRRR